MATKKKKNQKKSKKGEATRSTRAPAARLAGRVFLPDVRYIIALAKDKMTVFVAGEVATIQDANLWAQLSNTRGPAADAVVQTLVATNKPEQLTLLGGNLSPLGGNLDPD
jgi:hypothetical protein